MDTNKRFLVGVYDDDDEVLAAVKSVRASGIKVHDVYTPFPVHGLDKAIGHPRTRIPVAAFMFGALGLTCMFLLTLYTMALDWPMNIGGKDFYALPDFIPVMFEFTVLFTAFGMVFTFFISNGLWWGVKPVIFDLRATDDKFVVAIDTGANRKTEAEIEKALRDTGATEVNIKEVVEEAA
ncbi:DUF3341 domain-containing protein [Siphonobacter aquaeclarae]|jgi:hypothetical protein|uniref:Quinol:cytochrome c oxidoreductase membrane protein n=1 Tax=Siphonobacter aquaeclarae TaxID=563176 RepID=A0A1G9VIL3_9BACT|nr:DUF3341 domain-containing protein [Siphonobacter aquaeclarae]MBO9636736.1 DUF3341 domain-containing protein [Siphonobacter aquaeclarae]SDM72034.1 quinol:cytochrome c oxidoreductase membrane protein [Siphonobacter aquaeclarae]